MSQNETIQVDAAYQALQEGVTVHLRKGSQ